MLRLLIIVAMACGSIALPVSCVAAQQSRDPDGQHFDARGHAAVAAHLVPQVIAAMGRR